MTDFPVNASTRSSASRRLFEKLSRTMTSWPVSSNCKTVWVALTETIGAPFGRETDALNAYAFYNGGFFVIQDDKVHAIDWTNTQT
ncbi:hypothetical protein ACW7EJ_10410, partial [Acinetobacter soli]